MSKSSKLSFSGPRIKDSVGSKPATRKTFGKYSKIMFLCHIAIKNYDIYKDNDNNEEYTQIYLVLVSLIVKSR